MEPENVPQVSDIPAPSKLRLPRTFAALRHRNYQLFFGGQLVSLIGTWMQQMALPWVVWTLTHSPFLLGLTSMIGSLPAFFFSIAGGVVADRLPKRRIMLVTQSTAMVLAFLLAALTGFHIIQYWQIVVIAMCSGVVLAFDMPARQAFVVEMVGKDDLTNAIALNSSIFNGARSIGPAVAGELLAAVGAAWCFFINGISFLAVIGGLLLMRFPPLPNRVVQSTAVEEALGGFRYLKTNRHVLRIAVLITLFQIFGWAYIVVMPAFADRVLHAGSQGFGYLMAFNGVGALFGALMVASFAQTLDRRKAFFGGAALMAIALAAFSFSRVLPLSCLLLAFAGFGSITLMACANTTIQLSVPDNVRGRIMGVWALIMTGTTPITAILTGTAARYWGVPLTIAVSAVLTAAVVIGGILVVHRAARSESVAPA